MDNKRRVQQMVFSAGEAADVKMRLELLAPLKRKKVTADKAFDTDWLLFYSDSEGIEVVMAAKKAGSAKEDVAMGTTKKET